MRVYISVDMEGIGGSSHPHPTDPTNARCPTSVELMIGEPFLPMNRLAGGVDG